MSQETRPRNRTNDVGIWTRRNEKEWEKEKDEKKSYIASALTTGPHVAGTWIISWISPRRRRSYAIDRRSADWIRIGGKVYLSVDARYFRELFRPPTVPPTTLERVMAMADADSWWIYFIMDLSVDQMRSW